MADKRSEMAHYYDERAGEYEQIYFRDDAARRKEIDDEVVRVRELAIDKKVLEIACGTGYWTQYLSETAKHVTAIDIAPQMIEEARKKTTICPVEFVQADLNHLPDTSEKYDLIALGFWFSHHPRQEYDLLFNSLKSHLAPAGKIWMIDNNPPAEGPTQDSSYLDENGNNFKKRFLSDGREFTIIKNYFSESELREIYGQQFKIERLTFGRHYWAVALMAM
ncbi:MAG: class I SAM-dependent methyltransferase [Candidatus Zixiibacteriota bacterium]